MSDSRTKRGRVSPPWWALLSLATVPAFAAPPPAPKPDPALDVYAAPAQRVDIGKGRHLNLRCSGQGEPTVILEAGFAADSLAWARSQPAIAEHNRVCAYDRAGMGYSDAGPLPRDLAADVDDLHALIDAADIDTPVILVGHSYGSQVVRRFDTLYPKWVSALILIDPPEQNVGEFSPAYAKAEAEVAPKMLAMYRACEQGAKDGKLAAATPPPALRNCLRGANPNYSDGLNAAIRGWRSQPAFWESMISASQQRAALYAGAVAKSERHDGKPLIVLSADRPYQGVAPDDLKALTAAREQTHLALMASSRAGKRVVIENSSHDIPNDQPTATAIAVFEAMQMRKRGKDQASRGLLWRIGDRAFH